MTGISARIGQPRPLSHSPAFSRTWPIRSSNVSAKADTRRWSASSAPSNGSACSTVSASLDRRYGTDSSMPAVRSSRSLAARRSLDSRVISSRRDFSDRVLSYSFRNAATRLDCSTYADACFLAFAVFDSSCLFLRVASHWMDGARRIVRNDSYRPALSRPERTRRC